MSIWQDIKGTTQSLFRIAIGGVTLKNVGGNLVIRNTSDGADAEITASKVNVSGDALEINSDAASTGADWKYTIQRPASGMTAAVTLTLPVDDGTSNQVLATDGNGVLSWVSSASTLDSIHVNDTTISFGDSSPVALLTRPANAIVLSVEVIIDTPFDGTAPTLSVGVAGTTSKYMTTSQVNLKGTAKDRYMATPAEATSGSPEDIIATYVADSSSAGSCRVLVTYTTPS